MKHLGWLALACVTASAAHGFNNTPIVFQDQLGICVENLARNVRRYWCIDGGPAAQAC